MAPTDKPTYCVSIFTDRESGRKIIAYYLHPENCPELREACYTLVYTRRFESMTDALGHKLFLEQLSPRSMEVFIRNYDCRKEGPV